MKLQIQHLLPGPVGDTCLQSHHLGRWELGRQGLGHNSKITSSRSHMYVSYTSKSDAELGDSYQKIRKVSLKVQ